MTLDEARRSGLPISTGGSLPGDDDDRPEQVYIPVGAEPTSEEPTSEEPKDEAPELGWQPPAPDTTTVLPPADLAGADPTDALIARIDRIIAKVRLQSASRVNAKLDELEKELSR